MFSKDSLGNVLLVYMSLMQLVTASIDHRENLAPRHPCHAINTRLKPYIKWTEKLAGTQHKIQKDACGHTGPGPACCTNEVVGSYALSLGHDMKRLFDGELNEVKQLLVTSKKHVEHWKKDYVNEARRITVLSLETLFGREEYHANVDHAISTLFNVLGDHESSDDDVSKSAVTLFNHLIVSSYRRFMTMDSQEVLDEPFQKCLVNKAFDIEALPTQRELLYTLTSGASLIHILQTLFVYLDADIEHMKRAGNVDSSQCIQRYARETLCPMCISTPSSMSSSVNYDNDVNEPLCEQDCRFVIKTCFDQANNPYVAFAFAAQGYSHVVKQIQEAVVELKLVERLSKLHIYLYDMVVNATNTRNTYVQLQTACPNPNSKPFSPILSLQPIISERRELVTQWNQSLHYLLDQLQSSINNLNHSLTEEISTDICSNSNYAVQSNRCTQIDQHTPGNFTQWPLPAISGSASSHIDAEMTRNQLNELKKKLTPVQQMILSLRPRKKLSLIEYIPDFEAYDNDINSNDNDIQSPATFVEAYENDNQGSLSERLYNEIDGRGTTRRPTTRKPVVNKINSSPSLTSSSLTCYLIVCFTVFTHRISFTRA